MVITNLLLLLLLALIIHLINLTRQAPRLATPVGNIPGNTSLPPFVLDQLQRTACQIQNLLAIQNHRFN